MASQARDRRRLWRRLAHVLRPLAVALTAVAVLVLRFILLRPQRGKSEQQAHHRGECALRDHRTLGRYLRQIKTGRLVLDRAKITAEERLDGKYLLTTSEMSLSAEDVAPGLSQAAGGRTLLPRPQGHAAPTPRLSPPRGPHPCPHARLLPRADPRPRTAYRPDLAPATPPAQRDPQRPLRRPRRHLHPDHRTDRTKRGLLRKLSVPEPPAHHHVTPANT